MVGKGKELVLEEILTEKQIHHVLKQSIGDDTSWKLKDSVVKPATDGIAGFLGDHMKAILHVEVQGAIKNVHLFLKRIPTANRPKADFIHENNYFKREKLMFKVLDEIGVNGLNPWSVKAYIYTDFMIVMPDISVEGYKPRHFLDILDYEHVFVTTTSIARFHADYVNYEVQKSANLKHPYRISQEFDHVLTEPTFCDSTWIRASSKLSANYLKMFSTKSYRNLPDLEFKLTKLYVDACLSLTEYEDTVNVLIHKDLWINNIMFKYENEVPSNAILIDYQLLRYAPPAFDLMIFLYCTTDKQFRQVHEKYIFDHYYSTFVENLNEDSKEKIKNLGYDKEEFLKWCERARMFGMLESVSSFPYILMDPKTAQEAFDDPETYQKHLSEDRSEPVIAHALKCDMYKIRNLEITEEFVETYVLKQL